MGKTDSRKKYETPLDSAQDIILSCRKDKRGRLEKKLGIPSSKTIEEVSQ
jgi:hypothetical protein